MIDPGTLAGLLERQHDLAAYHTRWMAAAAPRQYDSRVSASLAVASRANLLPPVSPPALRFNGGHNFVATCLAGSRA